MKPHSKAWLKKYGFSNGLWRLEAEAKRRKAWADYWKGLGPRPVPVDHERIKRVVQQTKK